MAEIELHCQRMAQKNGFTTLKKDLIKELKRIGCCDACVLRYLNIKDSANWLDPEETVSKLLESHEENESSPFAKVLKSNPCSGCLGLLQPSQRDTQIENIVAEVKAAAYDAADVTFALSLPISLLLRNHSIWLHIRDKFFDYFLDSQCYSQYNLNTGDMNVVSVKEAWKNIYSTELATQLGKNLFTGTEAQFFVNVDYEYNEDEKETSCMTAMHPEIFGDRQKQKRKYHNAIFTRKSVEHALAISPRTLFEKHSPLPPSIPTSFISFNGVRCSHESLYIAGRYNKYSRTLSQTPWLINGERRMVSSVEELIKGPVARRIPHDVIKFSSSGREDVDVRMLGNGRPFVLEIQNPRITQLMHSSFREIENEVNSVKSIFIRDLQIVPKDDLMHIKSGETSKTKTYLCYCVAPNQSDADSEILCKKISGLSLEAPLTIEQKTPVRVLHRRPLAVRPRTVHWMKGEFCNHDERHVFFKLSLNVEAGTYIKELVHGDLGRTQPNISLILGVDVDILALDVMEVDLLWPPALSEERELKN